MARNLEVKQAKAFFPKGSLEFSDLALYGADFRVDASLRVP